MAMVTIHNSRNPTLISLVGWLLVANRQRQGSPAIHRSLLGFDPDGTGPPCTVSVPNLMTDRPVLMVGGRWCVDIRRLMYQPLIWLLALGGRGQRDDPRRFAALFDAEHLQRLADALVDRMGGNAKLERDFLGRQMLVDQLEALPLTDCQPCNTVVQGIRQNVAPNFNARVASALLRDMTMSTAEYQKPTCRYVKPAQTASRNGPVKRLLDICCGIFAAARIRARAKLVERTGFEPVYGKPGQIYSLLPLTTRPPLPRQGAPNGGRAPACQPHQGEFGGLFASGP